MYSPDEVPAVSVDEAASMLDDGALLIDVRDQEEWDEARIPGAAHHPMALINEWWEDLPRDREIVVHCHSGGRSAQVVHALTKQGGMSNVHNLTGGIVAWSNADRPVESDG